MRKENAKVVVAEKEGELCKCNCGGYANPGRLYINGHNRRKYLESIPNHHPCECGCGELVASNKRFVNGHQSRNRHWTEEQKAPLKGKHRSPETEFKRGESCWLGRHHREDSKLQMRDKGMNYLLWELWFLQ